MEICFLDDQCASSMIMGEASVRLMKSKLQESARPMAFFNASNTLKFTVRTLGPSVGEAFNRTLLAGVLGLSVTIVTGCTPVVAVHGVEPNQNTVSALQIGATSEEDVRSEFGSPLTDGTFRSDVWYYMFERSETLAFFAPEIVYRRLYAFEFDEFGVLENVATLTEEDGQEIKLESRVTPSRGTETNFFQEIFGNIGRFVGDENPVLPSPGRNRPPGS
jgi:outer membrane protein assembly factor BamE (lipoprotein component of BamABCDE complex)